MAKSPERTQFSENIVRRLAKLLDETGLAEIEYGKNGWHVRVAKAWSAPARHANPEPPPPETAPVAEKGPVAEALHEHASVVTSPMVGVVYRTSEPDAPPFVEVGDQVAVGQTLFLIEAMKVFNPIVAPRVGRVARILVSNGAPVEYDEPLLVIE